MSLPTDPGYRTDILHRLPVEMVQHVLEWLTPSDVKAVENACRFGLVRQVALGILQGLPNPLLSVLQSLSVFEIKSMQKADPLSAKLMNPHCRLIPRERFRLEDSRTFTPAGLTVRLIAGETAAAPLQFQLQYPRQPDRSISVQQLPAPNDPGIAEQFFRRPHALWAHVKGNTVAVQSAQSVVIYGYNSATRNFEQRYAEETNGDDQIEAVAITEDPAVFVIAYSDGNLRSHLHFWTRCYSSNFLTGLSPASARQILTDTGSHFIEYVDHHPPLARIHSLSSEGSAIHLTIPGQVTLNRDGTTLAQFHAGRLTMYSWNEGQYQVGQTINFPPMLNVHTLGLSFIDHLLAIFGDSTDEFPANLVVINLDHLEIPPVIFRLMDGDDIGRLQPASLGSSFCFYGVNQGLFEVLDAEVVLDPPAEEAWIQQN